MGEKEYFGINTFLVSVGKFVQSRMKFLSTLLFWRNALCYARLIHPCGIRKCVQ